MDVKVLRSMLVPAMVAGVLLLHACGGGSSADGDTSGPDAGDTAADERAGDDRDDDTAPPGDDPEAVQPYVEDLVDEYEALLDRILGDLEVVQDEDDPIVEAYLDLFEPGSQVARDALDRWADTAEAGTTFEPLDEGSPAITLRLDGDVETVDDDEVRFTVCEDQQYVMYDDQGNVQDAVDMVGLVGEGVAVRVEGEWHLRRVDIRDDMPACATEATGGGT